MSTKHKNLSTTNLKENKLFKKLKITIVVAEWNANITESLCAGAANFLLESGVKMDHITIHHVPGTFELPLACKWAANKTNADAVIALGCVIQGETRHFDFICDATANGIMQAGLDTGTPIVFGVLTTENMKQATERAGGKHGNKGVEAAETALKMCLLYQKF
jgi:6,7-dimethyl-8-ribityllumazine synthase